MFEKINKKNKEPASLKKVLIRGCFCVAFLLLAFAIEKIGDSGKGSFFDVTKAISLVLYCVAYILVGRKIIINAFAYLFNKTIWVEGLIVTVATLICILLGQYIGAIVPMLIFYFGISLSQECEKL